MLSVTGNINASPRKLSCKLEFGSNAVTDVKMLTYSTDWSGAISIGQVISAYITATIPTPNFPLSNVNVTHSMGINEPVEWVKIGEFKVKEESIRTHQKFTSFSAYDKLYTNGTNTYYSSLTFPTSLQSIFNEVCGLIGVTSPYPSLGINFTVNEDVVSGYTLRDVLGFCAAMIGRNVFLSPNGGIEFRWFSASGYTADDTRANVPYIGEGSCTVNRLICQGADGTYSQGSGGGIFFTCPFITQDNYIDELNRLLAQNGAGLGGFTYRKAEVDIPYGNFALQSGDIITVTTVAGTSLSVPIMANSYTYDGGLSSSVTSYGVSDYSGNANNGSERSVSSRRVQQVMENKQTKKREQQQYTSLSTLMNEAERRITGATGGFIRIQYGGDNTTAQLTISDLQDLSQALNLWIFNQNGLGHMGRASASDPWGMNLALIKEGTIVAERIAGTKISGVKLETFYKASSGTQSHIMIEDGSYTINKATVDSSGDIVGTPTIVGKIHFIDRAQFQGDRDTVSIQVQPGNAFTIGTLDPNNPAGLGDSKFYYYSDLNTAPSGAKTFTFYANTAQDDGVKIFGDVFFDNGSVSLKALKTAVDNLTTAVSNLTSAISTINGQIADLDRRVTALENP